MPFWSIPDKGEGANDIMSILFQEYTDALVSGIAGNELIIFGGAVTPNTTPDMNVLVSNTCFLSNTKYFYQFGAAPYILPLAASNATFARIDLVCANNTGNLVIRTGTAGTAPKPPARSANDVILAAVFVPPTDTTITADQIIDLRCPAPQSTSVMLRDDFTNATITPTEVNGLTINIEPGWYTFEYYMRCRSNVALTGFAIGVTQNSTGTVMNYQWRWVDASATAATAALDQDEILATGAVQGAFAGRVATASRLGTLISVDTVNLDCLVIVEGLMQVLVEGPLRIYHSTEVAGALGTVKAGSCLTLNKVGR
jgi:hypothetical protein